MEHAGPACPRDGTPLKRIVYGYRGSNPPPLAAGEVYGYCIVRPETHWCPHCRREFRLTDAGLVQRPTLRDRLAELLRARRAPHL